MPRFCPKSGFFLCKIHKNPLFSLANLGQAEVAFGGGVQACLPREIPLFFVQNHQNRPSLCWLTGSICASIMGAMPNLTQFPPTVRHPLMPPRQHGSVGLRTRRGSGCISLRTIRHNRNSQLPSPTGFASTTVAERKTIWNNLNELWVLCGMVCATWFPAAFLPRC